MKGSASCRRPQLIHIEARCLWKVEVNFEPISDDLLAVNANKTDAINFRFMDDEQMAGESEDYLTLRHKLSAIVNNRILEAHNIIKQRAKDCSQNKKAQLCPACNNKTLINGKCTNDECNNVVDFCQEPGHEKISLENGTCPICDNIETPKNICTEHKLPIDPNSGLCSRCKKTSSLSEDEIEELVILLQAYTEFDVKTENIRKLAEWFANSNRKHFVVFVSNPISSNSLFDISSIPGKFELILVNKNHPYYEKHIGPLRYLASKGIQIDQSKPIQRRRNNHISSL